MDFEYHSFLLRLWVKGKSDDKPRWMASLERVSTNEKKVYSSVEALIAELLQLTSGTEYQKEDGGDVLEG